MLKSVLDVWFFLLAFYIVGAEIWATHHHGPNKKSILAAVFFLLILIWYWS